MEVDGGGDEGRSGSERRDQLMSSDMPMRAR